MGVPSGSTPHSLRLPVGTRPLTPSAGYSRTRRTRSIYSRFHLMTASVMRCNKVEVIDNKREWYQSHRTCCTVECSEHSRKRHNRPDFDGPISGPRHLRGNSGGFIGIVRFHEVVSAELLALRRPAGFRSARSSVPPYRRSTAEIASCVLLMYVNQTRHCMATDSSLHAVHKRQSSQPLESGAGPLVHGGSIEPK